MSDVEIERGADENLGIYGRGRGQRGNEAAVEAHKGKRRRFHPTTSDREYSPGEVLFLKALDQYKRDHGRPWLTNLEVIRVAIDEGYVSANAAWCDSSLLAAS